MNGQGRVISTGMVPDGRPFVCLCILLPVSSISEMREREG